MISVFDTFTDENRKAQRHIRGLIWRFYRDLKAINLLSGHVEKLIVVGIWLVA